jgi:hypothetical protein
MKRSLVLLACLGVFALAAFGQASRPRVVATPTPVPPRIQNDNQTATSQRTAPVLQGTGSTARHQTASPTPTPAGSDENEVIKVETNLVTMPVSVLDRDGRFISGLQQKDFKIFENGTEQKVDYFQSVEQPFTVVLLIDVSPSTRYQIDQIHNAAIAFVNQLRPNDRVMVVSFDDEVHVLTYPTNDRNQLRNAINTAQFGEGTSLYEAVDQVLNKELNRVQGRKAIVLFTDGVDTTSRRADLEGNLRDVEETDVLIYPVRYDTERDNWGGAVGAATIRIDVEAPALQVAACWTIFWPASWAARSGPCRGAATRAITNWAADIWRHSRRTPAEESSKPTLSQISMQAFSGIAEELRRQYSLGYYPGQCR